jgi:polysaccharide biosynthesis protein PslH
MRILVVTPFLPDRQAAHGGGAYLAGLLSGLAEVAEVGLVAMVSAAEKNRWDQAPTAWSRGWWAPRAEHERGAAGWPERLRRLWLWRRLPLVAAKHWQAEMVSALQQALAEWRPDAALVEMAQMAQYLPFLAAVPTVLTDHEAGCPANTATGLGALGDARDRRLWRRYVARFYSAATLVQAVTAEDAAALASILDRPVLVRPPVITVPATPAQPAQAPPRALFVGDYSHAPNPEAARRLVDEVLPLLRREVADCELWLAGSHSDRIAHLRDRPGVHVAGFAPDLATLFAQVRLLLAPVWSGAGFRMKALSALAHGVPVVTNALGARGLSAPNTAMLVAESVPDLARGAAAWLLSPAAAAAAGAAAWRWAQSTASPRAVAEAQLARVREIRRP